MEVVIVKSKKKDKKFDAVIDGKKTISFGAVGYSDYTKHHDEERKQRYLKRHKKNENPNNPRTASFYATHVLWNKKSISASINDINNKFKSVHIKSGI
ncbi:MAG: hypothetical protein ACOVNU_01260 [Candidatus Kapaibacteriota bacterium]|jgi:hypothetical protein